MAGALIKSHLSTQVLINELLQFESYPPTNQALRRVVPTSFADRDGFKIRHHVRSRIEQLHTSSTNRVQAPL